MNKKVLVLEDEAILAIDIATELADSGWDVVGPAGTLEEAFEFANANLPQVALLDINVSGQNSFGLAGSLLEKGVKVVFLTGYSAGALPDGLLACTVISKPVDMPQLMAVLDRIVGVGDTY